MHDQAPYELPDADPVRDAILLDVDGTLIDIAATPDAVHVPDTLCATLAQIMKKSSGAVALISGRTLAELDRLFAPLILPAAGCHGAELRPSPVKGEANSKAPLLPEAIKRIFADIGALIPGVQIEDKRYTLAIHYRGAAVSESDMIAAVAARMQDAGSRYKMLRGKAVVEIKPSGFDKGTALCGLMHHAPFAGRRPIFFGDDVTDEDVFAALPEFGGVGISVGCRIAGADYCAESPQDIRDWLARLAGTERGTTA